MRFVPDEQFWFWGRRILSMGNVLGIWEQLLTLVHNERVGIDPSPIFPWNYFAVGARTVSLRVQPHLQTI